MMTTNYRREQGPRQPGEDDGSDESIVVDWLNRWHIPDWLFILLLIAVGVASVCLMLALIVAVYGLFGAILGAMIGGAWAGLQFVLSLFT